MANLNESCSVESDAPNPGRGNGIAAIGVAGMATPRVDLAAHWPVVQAYVTIGAGVLATRLKRDPVMRFHAFQALISALVGLAGHGFLTVLGGVFQGALRIVWDAAAIGLWAFLVWRAAQGRPFQVPIIAAIARRQAADENGTS